MSQSQESKRQAREYLAKHQRLGPQIDTPAANTLGLVVVIPAYNEPDIHTVLNSLATCEPLDTDWDYGCTVEVMLVVNGSADAPPQAKSTNRETVAQARFWAQEQTPRAFQLHVLEFADLAPKEAGVGLARKLGMDEATARLAQSDSGRGLIVSLDADCEVESNYLRAIYAYFNTHTNIDAASLYFEHRSSAPLSDAIVQYELHLRYYVEALRNAGFAQAFHTVGSAIAVRSERYAAQGGMNRRQAGEDFYFVQKLVTAGGYGDIRETTVYPSPRESDRAPFGTGAAMSQLGASQELKTYAPALFDEIKVLMTHLDRLCEGPYDIISALPPTLGQYLTSCDIEAAIGQIRDNTRLPAAFRKRFLQWFSPFRAMKFLNHASLSAQPKIPVGDAARALATRFGVLPATQAPDLRALLALYRRQQGAPCKKQGDTFAEGA